MSLGGSSGQLGGDQDSWAVLDGVKEDALISVLGGLRSRKEPSFQDGDERFPRETAPPLDIFVAILEKYVLLIIHIVTLNV
jgi:hypothetical protein